MSKMIDKRKYPVKREIELPEDTLQEIRSILAIPGIVEIKGLGSFYITTRAGRKGYPPKLRIVFEENPEFRDYIEQVLFKKFGLAILPVLYSMKKLGARTNDAHKEMIDFVSRFLQIPEEEVYKQIEKVELKLEDLKWEMN